MTPLSPGGNAALTSPRLELRVQHATLPQIDISAFLIAANGKVRSDDDMCFYGQPSVAQGAVALTDTTQGHARFALDLDRLPGAVDKVIFTATIHENRATFGALPHITITADGLSVHIPCAGMAETALILCEAYRRNGAWKLRAIGQGFVGGLAALATHLGVDIGTEAPSAPIPAPAPPPTPVSLSKVVLTKAGATSTISLQKGDTGPIRVTATWTDNGDGRSDNDDLDLRAGILMPDGRVHWLAASHPGSLSAPPFARHQGDVQGADASAPGTEVILIDPQAAQKLGGKTALVFSVYSAVSNGDVSIASLKPVMTVEHGGRVVECNFAFPDGRVAQGVYTYVIGTIVLDAGQVDIQLSGKTSPKGSEATPWIRWQGAGVDVSFDGMPVFKEGKAGGLLGSALSMGKQRYANL